ncbi:hypothetical protein ACQP00_23700 [Dactylosporangium sp. CS-047395]|uniref:hypothetical protein n=1 Tax=Dactylosporangium sp. CS-047395 TaxID=3239936 RepID=UPI003D93D5D8
MDGREFEIPTAEGLFLLWDVSADTPAAQRPAADAARIPGSRGGRLFGAAGAVLRVRCASQYSRPRLILELLDEPPADADSNGNRHAASHDEPPADADGNRNAASQHQPSADTDGNGSGNTASPDEPPADVDEASLDGRPRESNAGGIWHWEAAFELELPTGHIVVEGDSDEGELAVIALPAGPGRYGVALGHAGRAEHQKRIAGAGYEEWPGIQRLERYKIRLWFIGV